MTEDRFFLEQKRSARLVLPNVAFSGRIGIDMGERHIDVTIAPIPPA